MSALLPCLAVPVLLAGCGSQDPPPKISLADTREERSSVQDQDPPIRFLVSAMVSPEKAFADYTAMLTHVGQILGRHAEIAFRATYAESMSLVEKRETDVAFMCSGPYVEIREKFGAEILAVPVVHGKTTYNSCIIVRRESPIERFEELEGKSFAFTDPDSNSGKLYPTYLLAAKGLLPKAFFSKTTYTRAHDNSVKAVSAGLVDGAAVHSLILEQLAADIPKIGARVRVIGRSPPFAMPPIVVHPQLDPKLKTRLRRTFLDLHKSDTGRLLLRKAKIDRFVLLDDSAYDGIRRMRDRIERPEAR